MITQSFSSKMSNFAMSAKSRKPKSIYRSFQIYAKRLKMVTIENMSFHRLITQYDRPDTLFYCDPPYLGTEDYYQNTGGFGIENHTLLRDTLSGAKGKWLVSYNDCVEVRELYKNFNIKNSSEIDYTLGCNAHGTKKKVSELIITNF